MKVDSNGGNQMLSILLAQKKCNLGDKRCKAAKEVRDAAFEDSTASPRVRESPGPREPILYSISQI